MKKTYLKKKEKHTNNNFKGACDCVCLGVCVGVWFRVSVWCVRAWVCGCLGVGVKKKCFLCVFFENFSKV